MAVYPGILSRRKKVSPYIAGKCHGKIFIQCSLNHRTTVKALGSLDLGFSLLMGLNSGLGEDSPALEPSSPQNQHLPLLGVGCWARGVLPPRHFAGQLNNFPLEVLDCYFLLPFGSLSLKKCPSYAATYMNLKGWTDKLFLKGILEQYRLALEILGLLHGTDGGGIIHHQTSLRV